MNRFHSRNCQNLLATALKTMPVVVVTGARQTGKTTLVQNLLTEKRGYYTLDNPDTLAQAKQNPSSLLEILPITIDEVQRAPELLLAIKRKVDSNRINGGILITGSANLSLMANVSESLAGRAIYLELPPFCPTEWALGLKPKTLIDSFFEDNIDLSLWENTNNTSWIDWSLRGGYPSAIQERNDEARRLWFAGYIQTYIERDLRQLAEITNLLDFQRVMSLAANRVGRLLNQSELARDAGVSQPTCHRYLNLLETGYQISNLHNYTSNPSKGIIKSKKLFWADTGLALYLAKIFDRNALQNRLDVGFWLEQSVYQTLQSWKSSSMNRSIFYWRNASKHEVDFILEFEDQLIAIEVKSSETVFPSDLKGLRLVQEEFSKKGKRVRAIALCQCQSPRPLGENAYALPLGNLFPSY